MDVYQLWKLVCTFLVQQEVILEQKIDHLRSFEISKKLNGDMVW